MDAETIEVYMLEGETLISLGEATISDGKITFATDHFSTFIFKKVSPTSHLYQADSFSLEDNTLIQKKTDSEQTWYSTENGEMTQEEFENSQY